VSGGAYIALSGLKARLDELDRLSFDVANAGTAGYKTERRSLSAAERPTFDAALQSAVDVRTGARRIDLQSGPVNATGRDLDFALEGKGFFVVETPGGLRYTRNGHFQRQADGTLATAQGMPIMGEKGPLKLPPKGALTVEPDGTIRSGATDVGKFRLVDFEGEASMVREGASLFRAPKGVAEKPAAPQVLAGSLEHSNVSTVERMAQLIEVSRSFEALQRGLSVLMNDLDGRAIAELGKR
jgi:flagellar basal-body rod protein FlgF